MHAHHAVLSLAIVLALAELSVQGCHVAVTCMNHKLKSLRAHHFPSARVSLA